MRVGPRAAAWAALKAMAAAVALLAAVACGTDGAAPQPARESTAVGRAPAAGPTLSEVALAGEKLFNANCSACHGIGATGTGQGPPLLNRIYHPGHHPDFTFRNAVRQGVRQHHWRFGNMAPLPGVSGDDVEKIICYVREIQRAEGIFEGSAFDTVC